MKKWTFFIISFLILVLLAPVISYRLPVSNTQTFKAEILYKFWDLGFDDYLRNYLENKIGNRRVYLCDSDVKWIYVNSNNYKKLWPESPFLMKEKNYTIVGTFKIRRLLTGGYTIAEVLDTTHIAGTPLTQK